MAEHGIVTNRLAVRPRHGVFGLRTAGTFVWMLNEFFSEASADPVKRSLLVLIIAFAVAAIGLYRLAGNSGGELVRAEPAASQPIAPENIGNASVDAPTMADVLAKAESSLEAMRTSLDDYTARFVKQERDPDGKLGEVSEILLRVRTRFAGEKNQSPRRVYMRFISPASVAGREVIWGEGLYDGKMAVHEVGMLFQLKTIWLDPGGMIAMQGQRFPISEVGLVKLVEKLIERGKQDIDNPDVSIEIIDDATFDGRPAELLRVTHRKPDGTPDDFSSAEIIIDDELQIVVQYRSFGWPKPGSTDADSEGDEMPLLESYGYYDLKTNVGLTDADFDTKNPDYSFPRF